MWQKMAIFKVWNSVCRVHCFWKRFEIRKHTENTVCTQKGFFPKLISWVNKDQSYIRECVGMEVDRLGVGRPGAGRSQIGASSGTKLWFLATSYLEIAHWSILLRGIEGHGDDLDENGCFTSRTCVLRLDRYGSSGYFFFEKHSLIDFQIGKGRKREFRAAELRFSLHKEFCAAEIRFYLYKEFSRGTMWQKMAILH